MTTEQEWMLGLPQYWPLSLIKILIWSQSPVSTTKILCTVGFWSLPFLSRDHCYSVLQSQSTPALRLLNSFSSFNSPSDLSALVHLVLWFYLTQWIFVRSVTAPAGPQFQSFCIVTTNSSKLVLSLSSTNFCYRIKDLISRFIYQLSLQRVFEPIAMMPFWANKSTRETKALLFKRGKGTISTEKSYHLRSWALKNVPLPAGHNTAWQHFQCLC